MSYFQDAGEVYSCIGKVFEQAVQDEQFARFTTDGGIVVRLVHTDPDAVILVDGPGRRVAYGQAAAGAPATVELTMSADDAHRFLLGKLNLTVALAERRAGIGGSRTKALRLLPALKPLAAPYRELLRASGRSDLAEV